MSATPHPPIPEPGPGDAVSAAWARAVVRCLRAMRLRSGPGARVQTLPDGTTVSLAAPRSGGGRAEVMVATVPRISGGRVSATVRPLSDLSGPGRTAAVWALDLADGDGPEGPFDVVAFPFARLFARSDNDPEPEEEGQ